MSNNGVIKEASAKLNAMTADEKIQRIAELREKAERDEKSGISSSYEQGKEKGKQEGKKEGLKEEKISIAKKMLEEKMNIEVINKITGLSKEEIEKLQIM